MTGSGGLPGSSGQQNPNKAPLDVCEFQRGEYPSMHKMLSGGRVPPSHGPTLLPGPNADATGTDSTEPVNVSDIAMTTTTTSFLNMFYLSRARCLPGVVAV